MVRKSCLLGITLLAFGAGVLLSAMIPACWFTVLLGIGAVAAGCLILR